MCGIEGAWCTFDIDRKQEGTEASGGDTEMDVARFARERLNFEPDERQAEVLLSNAKLIDEAAGSRTTFIGIAPSMRRLRRGSCEKKVESRKAEVKSQKSKVGGGIMVFVGVDLGKIGDPSAFAVAERIDGRRAWQAPVFRGVQVRYLERVALGTPYTAVVERMREMVRHPLLSGGCHLTVDATGVGVPVIDMLRAARLACGLTAVTIGSGVQTHGRGEWAHVPKRDLMSGLQLMLEHKELRIAKKLRESGALTRELIHMG